MRNIMLMSILPLIVLGVIYLASLKPRIRPFTAEELKGTADYHNRINRKGTRTPAHLTPVVSVGKARPKRVLLLPSRQW